MPKTVAQLTGILVTAIVVFGSDLDVYYAIPLGIFAGAIATFFVAAADFADRLRKGQAERVAELIASSE